MANYYVCFCVFRLALPLLLTVSIVFRPCLLSAVYLLFLLYLPMVPVPSTITMAGHTGIYLKILLAISVLTALLQVAFQIVLFSMPPYANFLKDCETLEKILRHAGFVRLNGISLTSAITWLTPEIVMLVGTIAVYVVCSKLTVKESEIAEEGSIRLPPGKPKNRMFNIAAEIGKYFTLAALCIAAILRPSVQGGLYFLVFLFAATWWSCYRELHRGFAIILRCLMVLVFLHIGVLYTYQLQWPQEFLENNSTYARYFGLTPLMTVHCDDPREFLWSNVEWASYLNPLVLLWLYYMLAAESQLLLMPQVEKDSGKTSEKTPLIRGVSPSRKYGTSTRKPASILQDSTGSVTIAGEGQDDIPMDHLGKGTTEEEEENPTFVDHIFYVVEGFIQMLIRTSYILTNIIMMAWSITFHSWITFVLLLWANILWMIPNQRRAMLRSSPFLVLYAWFLLISAYVFSMDLTDEELPPKINDIHLAPIGFEKVTYLPCKFLLVRCLYTTMFWITLRQYMKEMREARQSSALADMVAPLQVTVGTAAGIPREEAKGNKTMQVVGAYAKNFLMKFWIWVVAITLFTVAITGERMTGFRIIYMALFLVFILTFQLSFRIWRKIMFGFWLTVILYSMLILVLVYTYQFANIRDYWTDYLHISETQQLDIGLEDYGTKQLFIRLATPTFFVIITVIQLHYFHKDFMEISDPKTNSITDPLSEGSSAQGGIVEPLSEKTDLESSIKFDLTDLGNMSAAQLQETFITGVKKLHHAVNLIYLFLEIHLPKIVLLLAMLLCIYDKCAIYLVIVVFIVLAFTFGRPVYLFSIYSSSVLVSLMVLARMLYQIDYIKHGTWNVTCDNFSFNITNNLTLNNAEWLGFSKSTEDVTLPALVQWNIIYILVVTLWSVVLVRQNNYRLARGRPTKRPYFMFPAIKRSDADKNLKNCVKYLFNYGYYKFGVEICFMATVALIGFRMDMYALLYAIWLCALVLLKRSTKSKLWNLYLVFIAVLLPVQYFMLIGLPPSMCTEYPWDTNEILRRLQEWAYLMDFVYPLPAEKLIGDFLLLLLVSRQALVFRIENRHAGQDYPGGSNENIVHHAEEKGFVIPVPDFITYCRSYLDIFKRAIFLSWMWITLAIMFLAGTNRVNIFSVGYLIGSFVFLWQGSDLYLRPIPKILKSWNYLLGYNVAVILVKTFMQLAGCVYIDTLKRHACWLVQLLAIGCIRKFSNITEQAGIKETDTCELPREHVGLVWDGLCFGFLLLQRRIFKSYNFFHMVNETKATTILASRGAELIEELRLKRMQEQDEDERRVLEKIKAKMDRIKATQQKIHGPSYKDSTNHFVDGIFPDSRPTYMKRVPTSYKEAIRSGDYYMFDDMDEDDDLDLIEEGNVNEAEDELDEGLDLRAADSKRTIGEVGGQSHTVVIVDPKDKKEDEIDTEPQPGTSKDEDISELSEPKEQTMCQKIFTYILFVWVFIESAMVSLTLFLNKYSRDHRYVLKVLNKEKKILKEHTHYNVGLRLGTGQMWQPSGSYHTLLKQESDPAASPVNLLDEFEGAEMSSVDQPIIFRLLLAMWYIILSHSDILCYFMIFLNQIKSATFLSLPLPLMVFFWGTLTVPRPTKTFWVTIIAYTETIVLIKCLFQFEILPWNKKNVLYPFYPPRIIGIERRSDYALWDLLLLLIVFFHRFLLKCLGLWKTSYIPAAHLADGLYKISGDELQAIEDDPSQLPSALTAGASGAIQPLKAINGRKGSDLQKLVEESEDSVVSEQKDGSSGSDEDKNISIRTERVHPCANFTTTIHMTVSRYGQSVTIFFKQLMDPTSRIAVDVYSYMFLCDFFNFFVILIGYSSFGPQQGDEGVQAYLEENRVPVLFLLMLIIQFALIIIDRAIFLRKNIFGKVIFQFLQIILLHIWLFIMYPIITERGFNSALPPQMYYMVKCFYLLLSAYQIRCGYPTRILGNFICKGYGYLNMFLFKGFLAIPFLFELRTVMDWMWTDTSMTVFDWIKMEDIFAHVFQLKCNRHVENEYPQPRGTRKSPVVKYLMGGAVLTLMIAIIWFPLVFFSLGNAVGKSNIPYDVTFDLRIGPYQPIYQMSVQSNSIFPFNGTDMERLMKAYDKNKVALTFVSNYESGDIAAVKLSLDSATVWSISPPDRGRMIEEIKSQNPLTIRLQYQVSHKSNTKEDSGIIREEVELIIPALVNGKPNPTREGLLNMLNGNSNDAFVQLTYIVPKFIKVTNKGTAKAVAQLMTKYNNNLDKTLRNITIKREDRKPTSPQDQAKEWWEIREECNDENYYEYLSRLPYADGCDSLMIYTFNDKIFPSQLNFITAGGIIGVYTTIVLVAGRLLRGFFAGMCFKIMFEDLPYVDRVLQLCFDIYLVREAREFCLEEDLFAKLVFLFRSPETLVKWTRPKEEVNDEDDEDDGGNPRQ